MEANTAILCHDVFAEDGDLVVVVGTGNTKRIFQVDSGVLRAASTKWRAMLRSHSPDMKMELPDEKPEAFAIAMKVAYYRAAEIPAYLSDETLVSIAGLCERYELHRLLSSQIVDWSGTLQNRTIETRLSASWSFCGREILRLRGQI